MTALDDLLLRLRSRGVRPVLEGDGVALEGPVHTLPPALLEVARQAKAALIVTLLRQEAAVLEAFIDGDAPEAERFLRVPEYQALQDRLAAAQGALFDAWKALGFRVVYSPIILAFFLAGDGMTPVGCDLAVYSWAEIQALEGAAADRVQEVHKLKSVFGGKVTPPKVPAGPRGRR